MGASLQRFTRCLNKESLHVYISLHFYTCRQVDSVHFIFGCCFSVPGILNHQSTEAEETLATSASFEAKKGPKFHRGTKDLIGTNGKQMVDLQNSWGHKGCPLDCQGLAFEQRGSQRRRRRISDFVDTDVAGFGVGGASKNRIFVICIYLYV